MIFHPRVLFLCAFFVFWTEKSLAAQSFPFAFDSGTTCRTEGHAPEEAVICGIVRVATPSDINVSDQSAVHPNPPAKGVSVYVYECDPLSPTCKTGGSLVNAYSSTSTDENGYYYITMRKVGNLQIRYLAFTCGGKLAGLFKVPSYRSFNLNVPVNCPENNTYAKAPDKLNPVNKAMLSCDIKKPNPLFSPPAGSLSAPISLEGEYSTAYRPQTEYNFWLEVQDADSRYLEKGTSPLKYIDDFFNSSYYVANKGAFYSKDCQMVYEDSEVVNRLCYGGTGEEGITAYENDLYNNNIFTVMNFLPNIPIKNDLLFFKDLTARQDVVNYSQNPTAPAQLLQTIFSNCRGKVYLRLFGSGTKDRLPNCELLKKCNISAASGKAEEVASNRQYSGGPTKGLANPSILQKETQMAVTSEEVASTEVCIKDGNKITIGQIQPPWSYCEIGTPGCAYALDKLYWSPEFGYFFGNKGLSTKVGYAFEGSNDTFYGASPNQVAWKAVTEKAGDPVKGGTYYTDNNYSLYRNNGLTPFQGGIAGTSMANTDYDLSNALRRPGEEELDRAVYQQGAIGIEDAGSNLLSFCENSNVNDHSSGVEFTASNENGLFRNNDFEGNPDHYFSLWDLVSDGKRTATSTVFMTTAANNRVVHLQEGIEGGVEDLPPYVVGDFDIYDSILTASHGDGKYTFFEFLQTVGEILRGKSYGETPSKSYYDRQSPYKLVVGVDGGKGDLRDDLQVHFTLSEENFEDTFPLPGDGHVVDTSWGTHTCYPWTAAGENEWDDVNVNKWCFEDIGVPYSSLPKEITRTCKVQTCRVYQISTGCDCWYENGSLVTDCYKKEGLADACSESETDKYNLEAVGNDIHFSQACAKVKIDCMSGVNSADPDCIKNHYKLEDIPEATGANCPTDGYWNIHWMGDTWFREPDEDYFDPVKGPILVSCQEGDCQGKIGDPRRCKDQYGDDLPQLARSCVVSSDPIYSRAPACNIQDAGPYVCTGLLGKDSNFRTTQQILRRDTATVNLDSTKTINNEYWKKFANPVATSKVYSTLAFQSTNTSVSPTGTQYNADLNRNKDVPGFGGASPEYKQISAHPLYANIYSGGMPIDKVCITTLGLCELLPVPDPEIISIDALNENINPSCQLNLNDTCMNMLTENFNFSLSPTFVTILNKVANSYGISASAMLTYLYGIHKFEMGEYVYLFSLAGEPALIEASAPWYGKIANCDDTNIGAVGAYDILQEGFINSLSDSNSIRGVSWWLDQLSTGRGATSSRCNFLDSTFSIAMKMKTTAPSSTCSSSWNNDNVGEAIKTELFGYERKGAYGDDKLSEYYGNLATLYENCRVKPGG